MLTLPRPRSTLCLVSHLTLEHVSRGHADARIRQPSFLLSHQLHVIPLLVFLQMCALGTALEVGSVSCLRRIRDAEVYRAIPDCSTLDKSGSSWLLLALPFLAPPGSAWLLETIFYFWAAESIDPQTMLGHFGPGYRPFSKKANLKR